MNPRTRTNLVPTALAEQRVEQRRALMCAIRSELMGYGVDISVNSVSMAVSALLNAGWRMGVLALPEMQLLRAKLCWGWSGNHDEAPFKKMGLELVRQNQLLLDVLERNT